MTQSKTFTPNVLTTDDGTEIAARLYKSEDRSLGTILIAPAMGVSQDYYSTIASWLALQGFTVITFDYRGMGESRQGSLRGLKTDLLIWAKEDLAAVVSWAKTLSEESAMYWIGHSLGGQLFPLVPGTEAFSKVITVSAGSGYWRHGPPALARKVWFLWYFLVPVLVPLCGYFPGKKLRVVGDLPKGAMLQWRTWCRNPDYLHGEVEGAREAYAKVTLPVCSFSFLDDELLSMRNIESLHSYFSGTTVEMLQLSPDKIGDGPIGHFGFFKSRFEKSLWEKLLLPRLIG